VSGAGRHRASIAGRDRRLSSDDNVGVGGNLTAASGVFVLPGLLVRVLREASQMTTDVNKIEETNEPAELSGILMLVSIMALLFVLVLVFA
jgi:hypothetical protein